MKRLISIVAIFSILFCSAVSSCGYAENAEKTITQASSSDKQKDSLIQKLQIGLTATCMAFVALITTFLAYNYGYNKGRNENSIINFLGKAWDGTTYGLGKAWSGAKYAVSKAWDGTTYGLGKTWNGTKYLAGTAWNGTKYGANAVFDGVKDDAKKTWDYTTYGVDKTGDVAIKTWCNNIGLGCEKNNEGSDYEILDVPVTKTINYIVGSSVIFTTLAGLVTVFWKLSKLFCCAPQSIKNPF